MYDSYREQTLHAPSVTKNRLLFPQQQVFTFWDYIRTAYERNAGLRLDHILLSSDHTPSGFNR